MFGPYLKTEELSKFELSTCTHEKLTDIPYTVYPEEKINIHSNETMIEVCIRKRCLSR